MNPKITDFFLIFPVIIKRIFCEQQKLQWTLSPSPEHKGSSQRNYSRGPYSPGFDFEDESHSKFMSEHSRAKSMYEHDVEDSEVLRAEYRRPRDVVLSLVGEFMCRATMRLQELNRRNNQDGKIIELLDIRSHVVSGLCINVTFIIF